MEATMEMNLQEKVTDKLELTESSLKTYSFSDKIGNNAVLFSVLKLKDSVFIWIGSEDEPRLSNMCLAMKSPYENVPLTTKILGRQTDELSGGLASQLTRRLGKPVFVSVNIEVDRLLFPELTRRLKEEINKNSEHF